MPKLNTNQVNAMAPDPASLKAGQRLADVHHWASLGTNQAGLWGECKGSGQEPYKVRVDLSGLGYACTCPSRKFPCKHVLGLLLLAAASPAKLAESTPPAWFSEWLEKRAARGQSAAKRTESTTAKETRQKQAARRAARREKLAETGVDALERWLRDFARLGPAFAQNAPAAFWDEQAARMVDSQLPGAARWIRAMAELPGSRPDWAEILLLQMGRLYLLIQAYRKLDALPNAAQQDVRALLGWTVNQEELLASAPGVSDDWLVLASRTDEDEKTGLRTQINWLWGKTSNRPAQILNFAFRNQPLDASLVPGLVLRGELVYFPASVPSRAVFKDKQIAGQGYVPSGSPDLSYFLEEYAGALGKNPWLETFPVVLENVVPTKMDQNWCLRDRRNLALPLDAHFASSWELLALSGGRPLPVFGLWDGFAFIPLAAWAGERYVQL
jgi:hypothetical protein